MAYQLYRHSATGREPVSYDDLDNKAFWCRLGNEKEAAFVRRMVTVASKYSIEIHPEKTNNPFHPDLLLKSDSHGEMPAEVKIKNSPLFYARQRYNIDPQHALTLDLKDSFNYCRLLAEGTDLVIFIWVNWDAHEMVRTTKRGGSRTEEGFTVRPMEGIWAIRFSKLRHFEETNPPPIHWYKEPFRHPPSHFADSDKQWRRELLAFDRRLQLDNGDVRGIASRGYTQQDGKLYPAGQSSGSYVFDLRNKVFRELYYRIAEQDIQYK